MSELKYNVILYKFNSTDITKNKNRIFDENEIILNTTTNDLYIADGVKKLSALTAINNALTNLTDYAKKADLADYAKVEDVRPILDFDPTDNTKSVLGTLYLSATAMYVGDGTTVVKSLPVFLGAAE